MDSSSLLSSSPLSSVDLSLLSERVGLRMLAKGWRVATAESCTGGGLAAAITLTSGSSAWFDCGIVSYSNQIKQKVLDVNADTLAIEGTVSEAVVVEMANGVMVLSCADVAVAITGIAGPNNDESKQPVGAVWIAWVLASGETYTKLFYFSGNREQVRERAVEQGLYGLIDLFN